MRGLPGAYVDSCVLLSLFLGDSGFPAAERWLLGQEERTLWVSHWVLVEFAAVVAVGVRRGELTASHARAIHAEFAAFRGGRLSLLEPRGADFLQAEQWLLASLQPDQPSGTLRAADALHLAMSQRHGLELATADGELIRAAQRLSVPCCWIRP
jgi:predicted nucleic acid-binding protein